MRRGRFGAVAVVVVSLGLGGCTGEAEPGPQTIGPESSTSATVTSSAAPSSSAAATAPKPEQTFPPEQQPIVDAYYGYYDAFFAIRGESDEQIQALLAPYATPERIEKVVSTFSKYRAEGKQQSGTAGYRPIEIVVDGQSATVTECHDSSQESVVATDSGQILESGVAQNKLETGLTFETATNRWLVASLSADENAC